MKHAVVIGSSKGIGLGIANEFLKNNFSVTITGTNEKSILFAKEKLLKEYPSEKIKFIQCNIEKPHEIENVWNESIKTFRKIDYWINNAGIGQSFNLFNEIEPEQISKLVDINIKGQMFATKIVYNKMLIQGFGKIYNMLGYGYNGNKMKKMSLYGTSKCAMNYFLESFAKETKNSKILVGGLMPGMVVTELLMNPIPENHPERMRFEKIVNILADKVDTIAPFLVKNMIKNKKHGKKIIWMTSKKAFFRFLSFPFTKRKILLF